jgi:methyl-accepting chemotaxis protein
MTPAKEPLLTDRIQGRSSRRRHLLLDLPIAWRLALGFLLAALIAAAAAGLSGLQRAESSSREADFYQNLLVANTSLTTASSFMQLLNTQVHTTLEDATIPDPSHETVADDQLAVVNLTNLYSNSLSGFTVGDLLREHADERAILEEAGDSGEVGQQNTLVASVLRTWQFYRAAQTQVMQYVNDGNLTDAEALERAQGEPTNSDAQSALRALIEFDNQIASSVKAAAQVEQQNQIITSLIAAILAFLGIGAVGWLISETLVTRLNQLRRVTQSVEEGDVGQRVAVVGRDEVADVSASVNGMLDTIVGLLEVTRRQRDALTNAAERLFTDVRVAGTGDLRINAAVGGDPIGMLANAFNFTIGRFRRFVLRTQASVEQLDVLARQQLEHAEAFLGALRPFSSVQGGVGDASGRGRQHSANSSVISSGLESPAAPELRAQAQRARELVHHMARDGAGYRSRALRDEAEQAYLSAGRVSQFSMSIWTALEQRSAGLIEQALRSQLEELRTLGQLLAQVGAAAYGIEKNSSKELADLDAAITRLSGLANDAVMVISAGGGAPASMPSGHAVLDQTGDLARLSAAFAREVVQTSRQVGMLNHELRTGVMPFRVDIADGESSLYAPGTSYGEVPSSSAPLYRRESNSGSAPGNRPSWSPRESRAYQLPKRAGDSAPDPFPPSSGYLG